MSKLRQRPRRSPKTQLGCGIVMLMLFTSTAACTGMFNFVNFLLNPGAFLFAGTLATLCTVPYAVLLTRIDRHEPEPLALLLTAFAWGAIGSVGLSLLGNTLFHVTAQQATGIDAHQLTAVISAPLVEESTKALGLLALYILAKHEIDNVVDGILYGGMVGLGFAWAENIHYYLGIAEHGAGAMIGLTWVRGVMHGLAGHATFTGLTGAGFGVFRVARSGVLRWTAPLVGLLLAMTAHALWNMLAPVVLAAFDNIALATVIGTPLAITLLSLPFVSMLLVALVLAWRQEERIIRMYLTDERCVRPDDLGTLLPASGRPFSTWKTMRTDGWSAAHRRRQRNHALVELAFARWHHDCDPGCDWSPDDDAEVVHWRKRLQT